MGKRSRKAGSRQKQAQPAQRVFGLAGWVFLVLSQDGTTVTARGTIVTTQGGLHLTQFGQEHFKMLSNASLEQGELFPNAQACDAFLKERAAISAKDIAPGEPAPEGVLVPANEAGNGE